MHQRKYQDYQMSNEWPCSYATNLALVVVVVVPRSYVFLQSHPFIDEF